MASDYPLKVFYDASCPVCALEMDKLGARDTAGRLVLVDMSAPDFNAACHGFDAADLDAAIHAVRPDGSVVRGMAVLRLAYAAAGLGWLLRPSGLRSAPAGVRRRLPRLRPPSEVDLACPGAGDRLPSAPAGEEGSLVNILVCGASGCVGRAVVQALRWRGHRVVAARPPGAAPTDETLALDYMQRAHARRLGRGAARPAHRRGGQLRRHPHAGRRCELRAGAHRGPGRAVPRCRARRHRPGGADLGARRRHRGRARRNRLPAQQAARRRGPARPRPRCGDRSPVAGVRPPKRERRLVRHARRPAGDRPARPRPAAGAADPRARAGRDRRRAGRAQRLGARHLRARRKGADRLPADARRLPRRRSASARRSGCRCRCP